MQATADRYKLLLPQVVDRHKVRMADPSYVAGVFWFQLEYENILALLMDRSLYPDPSLFLRELLQNALDACRRKEADMARHAWHTVKEGGAAMAPPWGCYSVKALAIAGLRPPPAATSATCPALCSGAEEVLAAEITTSIANALDVSLGLSFFGNR